MGRKLIGEKINISVFIFCNILFSVLRNGFSRLRCKILYRFSAERIDKPLLPRRPFFGHFLYCFTINRLNALSFCVKQINLHNIRVIIDFGQHRYFATCTIKHTVKVVGVLIHRAKRIIAVFASKFIILLVDSLLRSLIDLVIDLRNSRGITVPREHPVCRAALRVNGISAKYDRNISKLVVRQIRTGYSNGGHRKASEL